MGPAGESGPRRTPSAHDKGARGPNGCVSPLRAVPATGETAGGQALRSGRDHVVALREESDASHFFLENLVPVSGLCPALSPPSSS